MNNKGFTMIELLAAIVILGILMGFAIPTILNVMENNRIDTYLEDGKKLSTAAEYKIRSTGSIAKPAAGNCIVINMEYLQTSDFESAPNGGDYNQLKSFVLIKRETGSRTFTYYVRLVEEVNDSSFNGIGFSSYSDLSHRNARTLVNGFTSTPIDIYASGATELTSLINNIKNIDVKKADGSAGGKISGICNNITKVYYLD